MKNEMTIDEEIIKTKSKVWEIAHEHIRKVVPECVEECKEFSMNEHFVMMMAATAMAELSCWAYGAMAGKGKIPEEAYIEDLMKSLFNNLRCGRESFEEKK